MGVRVVTLLTGLLLLLGLGACTAVPPTDTLPTAAAAAVVASPDVVTPLPGIDVPPTWTAVPNAASEIEDFGGTIRPSLTPSLTPVLPTSSPRPPTATPTPTQPAETATPTRYVSFIPTVAPLSELGPSKLGLHVNRPNNPAIMEFVRAAQPAVMKGVGDLGFLAVVKEESPRTIVIGRIPIEHQAYGGNPEEAARDLVADQLFYYQANPFIDYWEGWNEPDPNMDNMEWYARFEAERVREMARYGFKSAIGGFPAGVPEMDEFALFVPAVAAAKEHGGIMTLHEGSAPTIDFLYGEPLPGYPAYPDRGAMAFRYRWYYREILEPLGLAIPLVISELGIDGVIGNRPGPSGLGWQDFQSYWVQEGRWGSTGIEAFINQMAWYDDRVREDPYVIGFAIFTAGGSVRWESYDVDPILPQLTDYVNSQY